VTFGTLLLVGRISKPHGLRGKVSVHVYNETGSILAAGLSVTSSTSERELVSPRSLTIDSIRDGPPGARILSFAGVTTVEQALELRGAYLFVDRKDLALAEDEVLLADLVGMEVYEGEKRVGKVEDSYCTCAGDVLVIDTGDGLVDFPFVDDTIERIDEAGGILKVKHFSGFSELKYRKSH
jgi:16S rRNA processing protein RimM